jgi:hypothetical protein
VFQRHTTSLKIEIGIIDKVKGRIQSEAKIDPHDKTRIDKCREKEGIVNRRYGNRELKIIGDQMNDQIED